MNFDKKTLTKTLPAATVAAMMAFSFAPEASAIISPQDALQYEEKESTVMLSTVAGTCSGVIVSPQWILTARHCFTGDGSSTPLPSPRWDSGIFGVAEADGKLADNRVVFNRVGGFDKVELHPTHDLALVKATNKIPGDIATIYENRDFYESPVTVLGWGGFSNGEIDNLGAGDLKTRDARYLSPLVAGLFVPADAQSDDVYVEHGDSGGGGFIDGDLMGIVSMKSEIGMSDNPEEIGRSTAWLIPVTDHLEWIVDTVDDLDVTDIPEPGDSDRPVTKPVPGDGMTKNPDGSEDRFDSGPLKPSDGEDISDGDNKDSESSSSIPSTSGNNSSRTTDTENSQSALETTTGTENPQENTTDNGTIQGDTNDRGGFAENTSQTPGMGTEPQSEIITSDGEVVDEEDDEVYGPKVNTGGKVEKEDRSFFDKVMKFLFGEKYPN